MKFNLIVIAYVFTTEFGVITVRFKGCKDPDYRWLFEVEPLLNARPLYSGKCNGASNRKAAAGLLKQALTDWKNKPLGS